MDAFGQFKDYLKFDILIYPCRLLWSTKVKTILIFSFSCFLRLLLKDVYVVDWSRILDFIQDPLHHEIFKLE